MMADGVSAAFADEGASVSPDPKPGTRKAGVSIRLARDEADIAAMIALGRVLHGESLYRTLPLDDSRMQEIGRRGLAGGNPGLLMAERDGELVGMAIIILGDYFFSTVRTATVQLLYVAPKARGGRAAIKLLRALRRWAASNGAHDLHVNVTTGIAAARTDKFLRHMGFRQTGGELCAGGGGVIHRSNLLPLIFGAFCCAVSLVEVARADEPVVAAKPASEAAFFALGHLLMSENDRLCRIFDHGRDFSDMVDSQVRFPAWELSKLTFNDGERAYWAPLDLQNNGDTKMVAVLSYDTPWPGQDIIVTSLLPHDAVSSTGQDAASEKGSFNKYVSKKISTGLNSIFSTVRSRGFVLTKLPNKYGVVGGGPKFIGTGGKNVVSDKFSEYSFISPFSYFGRNYFIAKGYSGEPEYKAYVVGVVFELDGRWGRNDLCYYIDITTSELDRFVR